MSKAKPTTPAFVTMSFEAWSAKFKPQPNTITANAPYDGTMFETYYADLTEVLRIADGYAGKAGPRKVWTLVEGDEGDWVIVDGYHRVNHMGYFITAKPAKAGTQYEVTCD